MRPAKRERRSGRGFTLIELLVVISLMVILAALLFPVFSQVREKARQARCFSNLKQIGLAVSMYADDQDGMLPRDVTRYGDESEADPCSQWNPAGRLETKLLPYIRNTEVFACPSATTPPVFWDATHRVCAREGWGYPEFLCFPDDPTRGKPLGYGWNEGVLQLQVEPLQRGCEAPAIAFAAVDSPATKVMAADSRTSIMGPLELAFANYRDASVVAAGNVDQFWPQFARGSGPVIVPGRDTRHHEGQNVVFFDGHVQWLSYKKLTGGPTQETMVKWFYPRDEMGRR